MPTACSVARTARPPHVVSLVLRSDGIEWFANHLPTPGLLLAVSLAVKIYLVIVTHVISTHTSAVILTAGGPCQQLSTHTYILRAGGL